MKIFHLIDAEKWEIMQAEPHLFADEYNRYGFVHCCFSYQIVDVARKWFPQDKEIIVVEIESENLRSPLAFEKGEEGGEKFPHVYGPINAESVTKWNPLYSLKENEVHGSEKRNPNQ